MKRMVVAIGLVFLVFSFDTAFSMVTLEEEDTVRVKMSAEMVNRIVCSGGEIKDVVYSKEKGLQVKVLSRDVFVKFPALKKGEKILYPKEPAEVYVVCGNRVFTIIGIPKKGLPPQTIQLIVKQDALKKNLKLFRGMVFEEKILKLLKLAYTENYPGSFRVEKIKLLPQVEYGKLSIEPRYKIVVEGEGLILYEYWLTPKENLELREIDFMKLAKRPVAISLENTLVKKGETYRLFVIERMGGGRFEDKRDDR